MKKSDFLRSLEDALGLTANTIVGNETLKGIGWWDSMAALVFVSLADEKFNLTVSGAQLRQCRTVAELLALLGDKVVD